MTMNPPCLPMHLTRRKLARRWQCVACGRRYVRWEGVVAHVEQVHQLYTDHASEGEIRTLE